MYFVKMNLSLQKCNFFFVFSQTDPVVVKGNYCVCLVNDDIRKALVQIFDSRNIVCFMVAFGQRRIHFKTMKVDRCTRSLLTVLGQGFQFQTYNHMMLLVSHLWKISKPMCSFHLFIMYMSELWGHNVKVFYFFRIAFSHLPYYHSKEEIWIQWM